MRSEILTIINTKSVRLDGAGGGRPSLTADDVNAALSACNPLGLNMLINRVCGEESASRDAYKRLIVEVEAMAKDWKIRERDKRLPLLSLLAIFETNKTPVCPACKGRKYNRNHKPCRPCKATGRYLIRDSHRAKALDVAQSTWSRVWSPRYNEVLQLLNDVEGQAIRQLNKRLGRH